MRQRFREAALLLALLTIGVCPVFSDPPGRAIDAKLADLERTIESEIAETGTPRAALKEHELKHAGGDQFTFPGGPMLFVANERGVFEHIFMGLYAARRTIG